jgi:hypothetical protein
MNCGYLLHFLHFLHVRGEKVSKSDGAFDRPVSASDCAGKRAPAGSPDSAQTIRWTRVAR